jgi:hypothetical protein
MLSGTDAASFGLVNGYLPHPADRNYWPRAVRLRVRFAGVLPVAPDEDVELARLTTAVLLRFLAAPPGHESPDFTAPQTLLHPALAVREILIARVLSELCFKGGDDASGVGFGTPVAAWHEDHAEVPRAARRNRVSVQRPVVAQVIGDDGSALSPCHGQDLGI